MDERKIVTKNLCAYFGSFQALKDISIEIAPNKVTAIIGPSGCGKSTFIRCLNRLHEVAPHARVSGEVLLDGRNIYEKNISPIEIRRKIGMVFQKPNVFPTLSIYNNISLGLRLNGEKRKSVIEEKVERSLKMAALWDEVKGKLREPATKLSGGQQQRICIARTLALEPEVILFDEPCSALDPISTAKVEETIEILKENYTVVIVTHNLQQAARVADYTAFFLLGEMVEFDRTETLFTVPKDKRTEAYLTGKFG